MEIFKKKGYIGNNRMAKDERERELIERGDDMGPRYPEGYQLGGGVPLGRAETYTDPDWYLVRDRLKGEAVKEPALK